MKKGTKIVGLILAAVLLMSASVFGTLAYLQSTTNELKNVFTVGKVEIDLKEAKTDNQGRPLDASGNVVAIASAELLDGSTGKEGNTYKLVPGKVYNKNPKVTVKADSEDCYVFVKVTNNLNYTVSGTNKTLESAADTTTTPAYNTIATQITNNGWTPLSGVTDVYYKTVPSSTSDTPCPVFDVFRINPSATEQDFKDYEACYSTATDRTIKIKAYAIQSEGFATANAAWTGGGFT